jgi:SAM-dependent methyltransferase
MRLWSSLDYLTSDHFDVLECTRCGLRQTHPQPAAESMVGYYGNSYYGKKGRRFVGLLERLERWFRESRSRFIVGLHPDPGTVLDVGCGRGAMLAALAERGWKRSGTELASGEATSSVGQDVELFFKELLDCHFPDGHFDVVTLWHVLEHLRDPVGTIGEIGRTLAPDGLLVLEVRNVFRWQSAMGRGRLLHLDVPRHLFHFSLPWLQERLEAAGFTPVHTGTFPWSRGPLVWCRPS